MFRLLLTFFAFSVLTSFHVLAVEERYPLQTKQQRVWFQELTADLRCPKCQNQNIADSNATVSIDMKRKVHALLLEGKSKQEIVVYMKQRYGDFVYYQPPVNQTTIFLWLIPCLALLTAIWLFFSRRGGKAQPEIVDENVHHIDELLLSMDDDSPHQDNGDQGK